jgi:hypothetical protein
MKIDVGFVSTFAVLASASAVRVPVVLGHGTGLCSRTTQDVCSGVSARMVSGACTPPFFVYKDGDAGTVSTCLKSTCSHQVPAGLDGPKCFTDCAPDCENKACGEDGCGGFCGACDSGSGCSNYECIRGSRMDLAPPRSTSDTPMRLLLLSLSYMRRTIVSQSSRKGTLHRLYTLKLPAVIR